MTLHIEATGRYNHRPSRRPRARCIARALREAARHDGSELPSTEGRPVKVAICAHDQWYLRPGRAGAAPLLSRARAEHPEQVRDADLAVLPGVGSARLATGRGCPLPRRSPAPSRGRRPPDTRDVLRPAARAPWRMEEDGGVEGSGSCPGRAVRLPQHRAPRIGWAGVEPEGEAFWFAHSSLRGGDGRGDRVT